MGHRRTQRWPEFQRLEEIFLGATGSRAWTRPAIRAFHLWMTKHRVDLPSVTPGHLERCLGCIPDTRSPKYNYFRGLIKYFTWLRDQEYVSEIWDRFLFTHTCVLPEPAKSFVGILQPTLKPGTCSSYRASLRKFHVWLAQNRHTLRRIQRRDMEEWLQFLKSEGLHVSTRRSILIDLRTYLGWLYDQKIVPSHPHDLIRRTDLPKLPTYLPRPLPPDADVALQARLTSASCSFQKGLALMRSTGLRVGELRALEYDCVRRDHKGNRFLKVPLGKMNSERLVPIDEATCRLIEILRKSGAASRRWLLHKAGEKTNYQDFRTALAHACAGLDTGGRMTTHRLRHTYATSLLNGGMSLVGLMRLLGHRDYRMTLRYAAITDETVGQEYYRALEKVQTKYATSAASGAPGSTDPLKMLSDVIRWLKSNFADGSQRHSISLLVKKLDRIKAEVRTRYTPANNDRGGRED
jgi:site-specific recombinase XerD